MKFKYSKRIYTSDWEYAYLRYFMVLPILVLDSMSIGTTSHTIDQENHQIIITCHQENKKHNITTTYTVDYPEDGDASTLYVSRTFGSPAIYVRMHHRRFPEWVSKTQALCKYCLQNNKQAVVASINSLIEFEASKNTAQEVLRKTALCVDVAETILEKVPENHLYNRCVMYVLYHLKSPLSMHKEGIYTELLRHSSLSKQDVLQMLQLGYYVSEESTFNSSRTNFFHRAVRVNDKTVYVDAYVMDHYGLTETEVKGAIPRTSFVQENFTPSL